MNLLKNKRIDFYLLGVILLSLFMNFFLLSQASTNAYYTVAVKSMMKNFHNFFYASFDPAGFITVDKPPVALWLQTLSAKVFGFSNFSVLLPEALAAVSATVIVYQMVKQKAGRIAAFISGITMSVTPIFIAVTRTNNVDSILILTLVIAAWAVFKAAATTKLRWLLLSAVMIGIGFNVKMLEAFMILPAIYLFYFIAVKVNWKKKIMHLVAATVVLAAISLSWAVVVDSIPADKRPYIGSSQTNSVLELAFGYNGVSRLTGQQGGAGAGKMPTRQKSSASQAQQVPFSDKNTQNGNANHAPGGTAPTGTLNGGPGGSNNAGNGTPANGAQSDGPSVSGKTMGGTPPSGMNDGRGAGRQGGMFGTGNAGPLRLFSKALSGQASWLLPFVLFSGIAVVADFLRRRKLDQKHAFAIFWLAWLVPAMAFFSIAGFFHHYYLSLLAPPIAALTGLGFTYMWRDFSDSTRSWRSFLLPIAFGGTLLFEAAIFYQNSIATLWIILLIIAAVLTTGIGLIWRSADRKIQAAIVGTSIFVMLLAPLYWTLPSTFNQTNSSIPVAGPTSTQTGMGGMGMNGGGQRGRAQSGNAEGGAPSMNQEAGTSRFEMPSNESGAAPTRTRSVRRGMGDQVNTKLLTYLRKHYTGEKYILGVERAQSAYSIMLKTNDAVMAMGGFSGNDPALTVSKLEKMVKAGEIKYFLLSESQAMGSSSSVTNWIQKHFKKVPTSDWSDTNSNSSQNGQGGQSNLYVYQKS
ncbi:ArnT family glycosyltransferase [Sporolactobacillus terrae]|uniref:ArnT family glycosyltransferase n=1 Tax=Sporolactobacillus terrae TaxID=269673 RepID=UPI0011197EE9|nr:glycosyltransferase family 39 protein [Sporolactobacillus terrae]UAK17817.1 glycosyltransferase family 39 protein [Sporolactobacillus terrae]